MDYFYVYYSYEEFGRGYLGVRKSKQPPIQDPYLGSFRDKTFHPTHKIVLEEFQTHQEAMDAEISLHKFFQVETNPHFANQCRATTTGFTTFGIPPVNKGTHQGKGRKQSPEHIRKRAASRKGKPLSEETKKRISESKKGSTAPNKGKSFSEETKKKMRESAKRRAQTPEGLERLRQNGMKANHLRDESGKFIPINNNKT